jgi:hypothetical protein
MTRTSGIRAVLVGGSIAGALDILFALTFAAVEGVGPFSSRSRPASRGSSSARC